MKSGTFTFTDDGDRKITPLPVWIAIEDAKAYSERYEHTFTDAQKKLANQVKNKAELAFIRSRVYLNFRKGFIAIKVTTPKMSDKLSVEYTDFDAFCTKHGITSDNTAGGVIYKIF